MQEKHLHETLYNTCPRALYYRSVYNSWCQSTERTMFYLMMYPPPSIWNLPITKPTASLRIIVWRPSKFLCENRHLLLARLFGMSSCLPTNMKVKPWWRSFETAGNSFDMFLTFFSLFFFLFMGEEDSCFYFLFCRQTHLLWQTIFDGETPLEAFFTKSILNFFSEKNNFTKRKRMAKLFFCGSLTRLTRLEKTLKCPSISFQIRTSLQA